MVTTSVTISHNRWTKYLWCSKGPEDDVLARDLQVVAEDDTVSVESAKPEAGHL